jgi:hypothetical protein
MRILLAVALAAGLGISSSAAQTAPPVDATAPAATTAPAAATTTPAPTPPAATPAPAPAPAATAPASATDTDDKCAASNPNKLNDTGLSYGVRRAGGLVSILVLTLAVLALCRWTEVLRGSLPTTFEPEQIVPADTNYKVRGAYKRFYSLAQSQMTWWFWIVGSSFIYIAWMTPDFYNCGYKGGLTSQALILLGIGVATGIGSAIIDQQKQDQNAALKDLADAAKALRDPATLATGQPALLKTLNAAAKELSSQNFLADVLSDANGISLHRFQSFAWTLILGLMFIYYVARKEVAMPELTTLELSLLGISATTFLGLKIPEKDTNSTPTG